MDAPEVDDFVQALTNVHRRRLLLELNEHNPHGEIPEASKGTDPPERLAVEMSHVHLPRLEDTGLIEWDRRTGTVTRGPHFEEIEPMLEALETVGERRPTVF